MKPMQMLIPQDIKEIMRDWNIFVPRNSFSDTVIAIRDVIAMMNLLSIPTIKNVVIAIAASVANRQGKKPAFSAPHFFAAHMVG